MMGVRPRTQTRGALVLGVSLTLVALAALTVSTTAAAQVPSPAGQEAKSPVPPSWIGRWQHRGVDDPPGYKPVNPYRGSDLFYRLLLQPWALEELEKRNSDDDPGAICRPEGPLRTIREVDFALLAAPGKIVIVSVNTEEGGYRRIYFDSPHPTSLTPTMNGDSRAHWEGETVIVDTIGLSEKGGFLNRALEPHSDALHLVERMRLILGGQYLEVAATVDDPKALKAQIFYSRYYKKDNAKGLGGSVCNQDPDSHWWRHYKAVRSAEKRTESKP